MKRITTSIAAGSLLAATGFTLIDSPGAASTQIWAQIWGCYAARFGSLKVDQEGELVAGCFN